jgi:hypothetical protein
MMLDHHLRECFHHFAKQAITISWRQAFGQRREAPQISEQQRYFPQLSRQTFRIALDMIGHGRRKRLFEQNSRASGSGFLRETSDSHGNRFGQ